MFAAEFGTGEVLWSILWFFVFFLWIWLVISIFADVIRDHETKGWHKALWVILIVFLPYLGVLVYLIVRGGGMARRAQAVAQQQDAAFREYVQDAAGSAKTPADELATLADLHDRGKIDDAEYASLKAKALGT
jgi:hypothetical protein